MSVDAAIRMGMAKEKLTSSDVAAATGVNRSTVSRWCNGKTKPSQKMQKILAENFRVSFSEFIRWSEL
ncbi:XRE family transcriptional regulator [Vibrio parahaemolyticus]|nr:XRE family transcriptional regulator [Vibrio parahaemolyticus]